jgi:V/A-type H+/Na+-transporting ATPase subunit I
MIVKMKRLTLLCLATDRDAALESLRELGVVHVTDRRPPEGQELEALRGRLADAQRALDALPPGAAAEADRPADELVAEVLALLDRRRELGDHADGLRRELARYEGFGEFDLEDVHDLAAAGIAAALGVAPSAADLVVPDGTILTVVHRDRQRQYFSLVAAGGWEPGQPDLGAEYDLVPWPDRPLTESRERLDADAAALDGLADRLEALGVGREVVARYVARTTDALRVAEVRAGMDEAEEVSVLSGYLPVHDCDALRGAAAEHGWGTVLDDPQPGDDVPTLLQQSRLVRPVRTVFDFLQIYPGYWESDVGWVFLPFFSLFFAMIVGDAGYATLLLVLTVFLQWRLKKVPRHVFHMMYIVGGATLFWGVITGSYFGIPSVPRYASALEIAWIKDRDNLIDLCFLIGAVHLSFAHVWNAVTLVRAGAWSKVPAQVGWLVVVWSMFFLARQAVLGRAMPGYLIYLLLVGIVLVAVFMKTPKELKAEWIDHALLPLTMIGNFVDILSYIRLFAVGYASVAVLAAFNDMAASIGFHSVFTAIAASLLLLFANALNIVLAGLGVLVHAVRLNTLEFSTHKGLAWQGHNQYTPFATRREPA